MPTVIITGANRAIGLALAHQYREDSGGFFRYDGNPVDW